MNIRIISNSFKADFRFIARDPMLLMAFLAPFFLILFLRLLIPLLSEYIYAKTTFELMNYYPLVAITIVSVIPMLFGMVYAFILLDENDANILQVISVTPAGKRDFLYMRLLIPAFLSFLMALFTIFLTDPVISQGWLRTIFISLLLSSQSSFTFLFIGCLAGNKVEGLALSKLYGVFLVAVPLGLLLHHPWNYLAFFSPLYWISWAWIIPSVSESLLYGTIASVITGGCILLFFRYFLKKHSV
jgi:fluoroquinolone transport system permease protein